MAPKIRAAVAHGINVPPEFEDKSVMDLIVSTDNVPFTPLAYRDFIRKKQLLMNGLQASPGALGKNSQIDVGVFIPFLLGCKLVIVIKVQL